MDTSSGLPVVNASLKYLVPTENLKTEKPYMSSVPFTQDGSRTSNFLEQSFSTPVHDVRDHEVEFNLNVNGFQFIKHSFQNQPQEKIEGPDHPYLIEVADFLKEFLKAKDVIVYDCNVRKIGNAAYFQAATSAHIDHTKGNAFWRFKEAMQMFRPNGVEYSRWFAVTLWRPISHSVVDWPLAVCDFTTIEEGDIHSVDTVLPHRVNEIYHLQHNTGQRWYYMSNQKPDEAILMKILDTDENSAQYSAHAAFKSRDEVDEGLLRHSADVRAFVLY
ncbi:hypothetical protein O1611_g238 [Lasiodiplodia mahajangana]|uniref:Uncharacterized protein n=1 Tax=Lasiodiplodia mahajangana TaxID=1108764 RepID=A0ACC2K149_9PEZI|nr:hypothetical protein O1611_g238 [Lasiodiplodia mahajangana]